MNSKRELFPLTLTLNRRVALGEPLLVAEHHFPNSIDEKRSQTTAKNQRFTFLTINYSTSAVLTWVEKLGQNCLYSSWSPN